MNYFVLFSPKSPPSHYRAEPVRIEPRQERPVPGPQVPTGVGKGGGNAPLYSTQLGPKSDKADKEAEVDALTDMLMKSMESASQEDFFG